MMTRRMLKVWIEIHVIIKPVFAEVVLESQGVAAVQNYSVVPAGFCRGLRVIFE